jgi:hypothetical protein
MLACSYEPGREDKREEGKKEEGQKEGRKERRKEGKDSEYFLQTICKPSSL